MRFTRRLLQISILDLAEIRLVEQAQHCEVDLGTAMVASRIDQSADSVASQYDAAQRSLWRSAGVGRAGNWFGRSAASASTRRELFRSRVSLEAKILTLRHRTSARRPAGAANRPSYHPPAYRLAMNCLARLACRYRGLVQSRQRRLPASRASYRRPACRQPGHCLARLAYQERRLPAHLRLPYHPPAYRLAMNCRARLAYRHRGQPQSR